MNNNYLYTIRYRPNTNPIESFFNQLKHYLKIKSPQNYDEIVRDIKYIINHNISTNNLENFINYLFLRANDFIKNYKK